MTLAGRLAIALCLLTPGVRGWAADSPAAAPASARPSAPAPALRLQVSHRSAEHVYVDGGRAAGLALGERLHVVAGATTIAELEVVYLAERSASCRVRRESRAVRVGDRVVRDPASVGAGASAAFDASATSSPLAPTSATAAAAEDASEGREDGAAPAAARSAPVATARPWARASGGLALAWSQDRDGGQPARDFDQKTARLDLALRDIGGGPCTVRVLARLRQDSRPGASGRSVPTRESAHRLYQAALACHPVGGRLELEGGRIYPEVATGWIDGGSAELRLAGALGIGVLAGREADPRRLGAGSEGRGSKLGGFLRLRSPLASGRVDGMLAAVRETGPGGRRREYLAASTRWWQGGVRLDQQIEVDRIPAAGRGPGAPGAQVTSLYLRGAVPLSAAARLSLSYDQRRALPEIDPEGTPETPEARFDRTLRQGLRVAVDLGRSPGALGLSLSGGLRRAEGDGRAALSLTAGLRPPAWQGLRPGLDGSWFRSRWAEGWMATARLGRRLGSSWLAELSGGQSLTRVLGTDPDPEPADARIQRWLRLSIHGDIGRGLSLTGALEREQGDEARRTRASAELGLRL